MKARIKATGEIVDAVITQRETHTGEQVYMTDDSRLIEESGLDFNVDDTPDYWTRLEHTYAGMAMQGLILTASKHMGTDQEVAQWAKEYAHALVEKMKEERK